MNRLHPEQLICGLLALAVGTVIWRTFVSLPTPLPTGALSTPKEDEIASSVIKTTEPPFRVSQWPAPRAQSRGREWVFGLFTPPEIEYSAGTRSHRVALAANTVVFSPPEVVAGAPELLHVRLEDYPLQLTGFVGSGALARGIFENRQNGETLLLKAGDPVPALAVTIEIFTVEPASRELPVGMPASEPRASAIVRAADGSARRLVQGVITPGAGLLAKLALGGQMIELRVGEAVALGTITYRVTKIRLAPAMVDVIKESAVDGSTAIMVLNVNALPDSNQPSL